MKRSPLHLAALAAAALPEVDIVGTTAPQTSTATTQFCGVMDNRGRRWIVHYPLSSGGSIELEAEVAASLAMSQLSKSGTLPFTIPEYAGSADVDGGGRALIYHYYEGAPLQLEYLEPGPGLAANIGRMIAIWHNLATSHIAEAGLPVYSAEQVRERIATELREAIATGLVPPVLQQWWEEGLNDEALWDFQPCPVHGDLSEDAILIARSVPVTVRDLHSVHVGDPAQDFSWLTAALPTEVLDTVFEAYAMMRNDSTHPDLLRRANLHAEFALARWLLHGVREQSNEIRSDAISMLTELAAAVAAEREEARRAQLEAEEAARQAQFAPPHPDNMYDGAPPANPSDEDYGN